MPYGKGMWSSPPHCTYKVPSYPSICDYFLGCILWYQGLCYQSVLSQKAPEEVLTSEYEGALYVQCGRDDHIHYIDTLNC